MKSQNGRRVIKTMLFINYEPEMWLPSEGVWTLNRAFFGRVCWFSLCLSFGRGTVRYTVLVDSGSWDSNSWRETRTKNVFRSCKCTEMDRN
jgi:hypothetical protein